MDIRQYHETEAVHISMTAFETGLPTCRSQWPPAAREAFGEVLGDLNGWCREYDWPMIDNARVAEEAVRRTWGGASIRNHPRRSPSVNPIAASSG